MEDGPSKPNPANVLNAIQQIGVKSAWMIGDTPDDAGAAVAAGINAVGIIAPTDDPKFAAKKLIDAKVCKIVESLKEFGDLLP
jgi:phosphoglycolate phosphatase-like HAD superfamily hydrolase